MLNRRELLLATAASPILLFPTWSRAQSWKRTVIRDYSRLDAVRVAKQFRPVTTENVREAVSDWPKAISVGGGRFSMGGQIAAPDSLHLDMRSMNRVMELDTVDRVVRVQAGVSWRELQEAVDPKNLSVEIMQSFSNFTVGGSIGVNCHGRYVGRGPLINSVRAIQLVTADGEVHELTPDDELFGAVFGGYGGLGVVTEVELELDRNSAIRRNVEKVPLEEYPQYFQSKIRPNVDVVLHNADLRPPNYAEPRLITWTKTESPVTIPERLIPKDRKYELEKTLLWVVSEFPSAKRLRRKIEDELFEEDAVVWRNYEASLDTEMLEPRTKAFSVYLLQEYFIPEENFLGFLRAMRAILKRHRVNALNVSIRHSPSDPKSLLTWAKEEVFSFVLYYKQRNHRGAQRTAEKWTRELITAALQNAGRYYLPYRLHASNEQFEQAYPEIKEFASLKSEVDPNGQFRNLLWDKYL